jgi:hypothetical protein
METDLKRIAIKIVVTLIITPLMGYALLRSGELFEKAWKSNSRRKRWLAMCGVFLLLAAISGWFQ